MKQVHFKGNLPSHMQLFAKQLGGVFSQVGDTEFWEAQSIAEFEKGAAEIGYEIVPTIDGSTDRAFLVGFDAEDSVIVGSDGDSYSKLRIYFIEITPEELKAWDKKIKAHRAAQEADMRAREELSRQAHKKRKKLQRIVNEQVKKK